MIDKSLLLKPKTVVCIREGVNLLTEHRRHLPFNMTFENIAIKGEFSQNDQFHLSLQYFQLFININLSVF